MIIDLVFAGIIGFCGTRWPIRIRVPIGGPGSGGYPDDPYPPNCPRCSLVLSILGGIAAVYFSGSHFTESGTLSAALLAFFSGSFAAQMGDMMRGMISKSKA